MNCRYVSSTEPRVINRRHLEDCSDDECKGCLPCPEPHCRVCGKEHHEGACPACAGEVRDDLAEILKLCRGLHSEAVHQGVDSEAMALLLPSANPEAWGHITTSLKVGRLPAGYLQCDRCDNSWPCSNPKHATGELHPLFVLTTWEDVWRDALEHETDALASIEGAAAYLAMQLTYMAGYEHAPFEDFARDLRRCRNHLEAVLHDGEQRDTGAPCLDCDIPQVQVFRGRELPWSTREKQLLASEDGWACPRCRKWSNDKQYRFSMKAEYIDHAEWLTDVDMVARVSPMMLTGKELKAGTVRAWASEGSIRKRRHSERTEYCVAEVLAKLGLDTAA